MSLIIENPEGFFANLGPHLVNLLVARRMA
jgi:hypothetical protein